MGTTPKQKYVFNPVLCLQPALILGAQPQMAELQPGEGYSILITHRFIDYLTMPVQFQRLYSVERDVKFIMNDKWKETFATSLKVMPRVTKGGKAAGA